MSLGIAAPRPADLHRAYRAVLVAVSYPGRRVAVASTTASALRLMLLSTWEPCCPIALAGSPAPLPWEPHLVEDAVAELLVTGGGSSGGALGRIPRGGETCPEAGATAVYAVSEPMPELRVRLEGPGILGSLATRLPLDPAELAARDAACAAWPLGVDILIVDSLGRVSALPRTTRVERLG